MEPLLFVVNTGGMRREYALYRRGIELANISTEETGDGLAFQLVQKNTSSRELLPLGDGAAVLSAILERLVTYGVLSTIDDITGVAVRLAAPSGYFLEDHLLDNEAMSRLEELRGRAPFYLTTVLEEIHVLRTVLPHARLVGVSDSSFHAKKPDYTWNYGINLEDADRYDIKRFGYHGIALESIMRQLKDTKYVTYSKVVVCYLDSTASVTAVYNGKSIDTTTGYAVNEGMIMPTQSGTFDLSAGVALSRQMNCSPEEVAYRLQSQAGLAGISGSTGDIAELIAREGYGDHRAGLAVAMYVYNIRQAIARMVASLEGIDLLVFTGMTGQTSPVLRERICSGLGYLGLAVSAPLNTKTPRPGKVTPLHPRTRSKPIVIVPVQHARVMQSRARKLLLEE